MQVAVGRDLFLDFCTGFPGSFDNTRALHDHQFMETLELASIYAKAGERDRERETERGRQRQRQIQREIGILKGPWSVFFCKRLDSKIENVSNVIIACFVLHNMFRLNWVKNSAEHQSFLLFSFVLLYAPLRFCILSLHCLIVFGTQREYSCFNFLSTFIRIR